MTWCSLLHALEWKCINQVAVLKLQELYNYQHPIQLPLNQIPYDIICFISLKKDWGSICLQIASVWMVYIAMFSKREGGKYFYVLIQNFI